MLAPGKSIKPIVAAVASPFAAASAALVAVLSVAEYFRRGSVSLFLDFRLLAGAALIFAGLAAWSEEAPGRRLPSSVSSALALAAAAPIIWKTASAYGRLGLAVFAAGLVSLAVIFLASALPDKDEPNP